MKTFTNPKALVENLHYQEQRQKSLAGLSDDMIDVPIVKLINFFNKLPYCFTMQSCYGHFLYNGQKDPYNFRPLPATNTIARVEYKISYIAFCIENSDSGRCLLEALKKIVVIDPENIQFCCAEWFWKRQVNSYVLQVEPDRFKQEDRAKFDYKEALNIEKIRNEFFIQIEKLLQKQQD
ncbi:hypothetical protein [Desulfobacula sp.]|uniref:hypothetical protein n=1 Tax=Desulfobacula sp. TaxID=2593537 RepID=UPI0025B94D5B|nr:hypothetical protein [Desulfobacula sp.]MBC2703442.1 hypothetical protein [Desulfobacula sp.]